LPAIQQDDLNDQRRERNSAALYPRLGPQCSDRSLGGRRGRKLARGGMTQERWRAFLVVKKTEQSSKHNNIEGIFFGSTISSKRIAASFKGQIILVYVFAV
jgi:hypothetical protein